MHDISNSMIRSTGSRVSPSGRHLIVRQVPRSRPCSVSLALTRDVQCNISSIRFSLERCQERSGARPLCTPVLKPEFLSSPRGLAKLRSASESGDYRVDRTDEQRPSRFSSYALPALTLAIAVLATGALFQKFYVPLSRSGFFASLSLIFASEIGDKTFFIAALLAMRYGKILSLLGSVSSLSLMTVISVIIGYAVQRVPTIVESSEVIGKYLSAASLLYFGLKSLFTAATQGDSTAGEELSEAEEQVASAEESGTIKSSGNSGFAAFVEIAGLIFVAEWGDRSMLATIALGAAQSPIGVAGGAIVGHTVATVIAVIGGAALADKISERTVNIIGGTLFIVFALATVLGFY